MNSCRHISFFSQLRSGRPKYEGEKRLQRSWFSFAHFFGEKMKVCIRPWRREFFLDLPEVLHAKISSSFQKLVTWCYWKWFDSWLRTQKRFKQSDKGFSFRKKKLQLQFPQRQRGVEWNASNCTLTLCQFGQKKPLTHQLGHALQKQLYKLQKNFFCQEWK